MTPLAFQLAARAQYTGRARARRTPRTPPKAAPPRGLVVAYGKFVRDLGRQMDAAAVEVVAPRLPHVARSDATRTDGPTDVVVSVGNALRSHLERLVRSQLVVRTLDDLAARTSAWSGAQFDRQIRSALGIDLPASSPQLAETIRLFRHAQMQMIGKLSADKAHRVESLLTRAAQTGARVEDIAREIAADAAVTTARAATIARTSVLGLNAQVTEARHLAAGIVSYTWSAVMDERTRKSHRALNGKVFRYDDPPTADGFTGNPGSIAPNCRCTAIPILPSIGE